MESALSTFAGSNASAGKTSSTQETEQTSDQLMSGPSEDELNVPVTPTRQMPTTPTSTMPEKAAKPGSGGKKKKRKTPTDVNAPKKPVSAYITYLNERRETVKSESPTMSYPDILKKLAAEWSGLSPEGRKKYHDEANKAREKYNQEISEYKTTDLYKKFCEEQNTEQQQQKLQIQFPSLVQKVAQQQQQQKSPPAVQTNLFTKQSSSQGPLQQTSQLAAHLQSPTTFRAQQQQQLMTQQHQQMLQQHLSGPTPSTLKREMSSESPPSARVVGPIADQAVGPHPTQTVGPQAAQTVGPHPTQTVGPHPTQTVGSHAGPPFSAPSFHQRPRLRMPGVTPLPQMTPGSQMSPGSHMTPGLRATPMSPNQTPSPRVMSPTYHPGNMNQNVNPNVNPNVNQPYRYPNTNSAVPPTTTALGLASGRLTPGGLATGGLASGGLASGGLATGGLASGGLATGGLASAGGVSSPLRSNSSMTVDAGQDELRSRPASNPRSRLDSAQSYDIPIFTEEFLEHNRAREGELRHYKKHNAQLEEQNVMLSKHVENMKAAIGKLDSDAVNQRTHNRSLQQQLDNVRSTLSTHLSALPLPGSKDPPNRDNIDDYMNAVYRMMTESPKPENQHFINVFKETIWNLEFGQNQA